MKSLFTVFLWLYFPIFLFSQYTSSTEDKTPPSWRYGFSISGITTGLNQPGNMGDLQSSDGVSFNYQLAIYKKISPHFFMESALGIDMIKRNQNIEGGFAYTENNSTAINNTTIENNYSEELHEAPINYRVNFTLRTTKFDHEEDYEEGDIVPVNFRVLNRINSAKIPLSINYKFGEKKLSAYTGFGIAANFLLSETIDLTSSRQHGLTIGDRIYKDTNPFSTNRYNRRNQLQSYEASKTNAPNKVMLDGFLKFGLIHEHWRNTFILNINYHRSITNFYGEAKLEQVGIQVGWRYGLYL